ncbi:hypothetical protein ACQKL0_02910 [Peribacillus sp. NPDC097264]
MILLLPPWLLIQLNKLMRFENLDYLPWLTSDCQETEASMHQNDIGLHK